MVTEHNCEDRCVTLMTYHGPARLETPGPAPSPLQLPATTSWGRGESAPVTSHCTAAPARLTSYVVLSAREKEHFVRNNVTHTTHCVTTFTDPHDFNHITIHICIPDPYTTLGCWLILCSNYAMPQFDILLTIWHVTPHPSHYITGK